MSVKPQITESESRELRLDSYVTYVHHHHCRNCGCDETFSQIYEVWLHPTSTRITTFKDLRPLAGLELLPLHMARIDVQVKQIPLCCQCVGTYRARGQGPKVVTNQEWQETLRRKYTAQAEEEKIAKTSSATPKAVPRLDQI